MRLKKTALSAFAVISLAASSAPARACIVSAEVQQILDLSGADLQAEGGRAIKPYCARLFRKLDNASDPQKYECNRLGPDIMRAESICHQAGF